MGGYFIEMKTHIPSLKCEYHGRWSSALPWNFPSVIFSLEEETASHFGKVLVQLMLLFSTTVDLRQQNHFLSSVIGWEVTLSQLSCVCVLSNLLLNIFLLNLHILKQSCSHFPSFIPHNRPSNFMETFCSKCVIAPTSWTRYCRWQAMLLIQKCQLFVPCVNLDA